MKESDVPILRYPLRQLYMASLQEISLRAEQLGGQMLEHQYMLTVLRCTSQPSYIKGSNESRVSAQTNLIILLPLERKRPARRTPKLEDPSF